jgi:hypothetical protein
MLHYQKINEGQVISETGPKLLNRLALKSQKETELYSLRVYKNQSKAIVLIRSGHNMEHYTHEHKKGPDKPQSS